MISPKIRRVLINSRKGSQVEDASVKRRFSGAMKTAGGRAQQIRHQVQRQVRNHEQYRRVLIWSSSFRAKENRFLRAPNKKQEEVVKVYHEQLLKAGIEPSVPLPKFTPPNPFKAPRDFNEKYQDHIVAQEHSLRNKMTKNEGLQPLSTYFEGSSDADETQGFGDPDDVAGTGQHVGDDYHPSCVLLHWICLDYGNSRAENPGP